MIRIKYFIFTFFVVFLAGCSSPNETHVSGVLLPLTSGNSWQYKTHFINGATGKDSVGVDSAGCKLDSNYPPKYYLAYYSTFFQEYFMYIENRIWGCYISQTPDMPKILMFKFPVSDSDEYTITKGVDPNPDGTCLVISTKEPVTTPGGVFSSIHYRLSNLYFRGWNGDWFFTPNIGLVKRLMPWPMYDSTSKVPVRVDTIVHELQSYHIN
jgi:hypothetical protein